MCNLGKCTLTHVKGTVYIAMEINRNQDYIHSVQIATYQARISYHMHAVR